jgi:hypothetical protein
MIPYWIASLIGSACFMLGLIVASLLASNRVIDLEKKVGSLYGRIADLEQARIRRGAKQYES